MQTDPKNFDLNHAVREARNMYASFINLLDTNAVVMKQKHQFDKAPTEFGYRDFGIFPNHLLSHIGKDMKNLPEKTAKGELSKKQVLLEVAV